MANIKDIPNSGVMRVELTAFLGARVDTVLDENGNEERCICIPLDRNNLHEGSTGRFLHMPLLLRQEMPTDLDGLTILR